MPFKGQVKKFIKLTLHLTWARPSEMQLFWKILHWKPDQLNTTWIQVEAFLKQKFRLKNVLQIKFILNLIFKIIISDIINISLVFLF